MSALPLARDAIRDLVAYSSARDEGAAAEIMLDANESPWTAPGAVALNRYPEPQPLALLDRLGALYCVSTSRLVVGRGVDEGIDLLVRTFCESRRDRVVICPPTYGMYEVAAAIQGAAIVRVPLDSAFAPDEGAIAATLDDESVRLVFLCSPNNPTGTTVNLACIDTLCRRARGRALIVVDEAYVELCPERSCVPLLDNHDNLVVLRTLSKAWALAGARCGTVIASPEVAELLNRVRPPYPLPQPTIDAVLAALSDEGIIAMRERVRGLVEERSRLGEALSALSEVQQLIPSEANFLLVRVTDPASWMRRCAREGIVIRDRSSQVEGAVRITVGTQEQNDRLIAALAAGES